MSVQFGMWNFDERPVDPEDLSQVRRLLEPYGPDSETYICRNGLAVFFRAFHTTEESRREIQPQVFSLGNIIAWDGRLDNRRELAHELGDGSSQDSSDFRVVVGCFERWGTGAFGKLVGDWALSIWNPSDKLLLLAKDFIGSRQLYYSVDKSQVIWSTILDPFLAFAGKSFRLCEEYIAGWLASFPSACLTPYEGIRAVPPASYVAIRRDEVAIKEYWSFDAGRSIRYCSDHEYEEHFRTVFAQSVERRLRSDRPVLAELSGGLDSSSIVCIADTILAGGAKPTPRLDTISYYDDSEPNWDERPYFTEIEEKRGRTGCHIDLHPYPSFDSEFIGEAFASSPGSFGQRARAEREATAHMISGGMRVLLSGVGGDEFMGGVPTPIPELEDLLANGRFRLLANRLKTWALSKRRPWFHLFFEAARGFFPPYLTGVPEYKQPAPWLTPSFAKRQRLALRGYENRLKLFGSRPSFQENTLALEALRRQIGCSALAHDPPYEKRYPWVDRDLLEFIFAIPREQLIRPGQRRSLMRRALVNVVPQLVLNRERKAYVTRAPLAMISRDWSALMKLSGQLVSASLGMVDPRIFRSALEAARYESNFPLLALMRTLGVELWLKNLQDHGCLSGDAIISASSLLNPRNRSRDARLLLGEFS